MTKGGGKLYCWALALALFLAAPSGLSAQQQGFYHTVNERTSVSALASRFGVSPGELASANRLAPNAQLVSGTRVWVPRSAGAASVRSQSGRAQPVIAPRQTTSTPSVGGQITLAPSSSSAGAGGGASYAVRTGDSLWKIAQRHGMSAEQLARHNRLDPSAPLRVGQQIQIPSASQPSQQVIDVPGGGLIMASSKPPEPRAVSASQGSTTSVGTPPRPSRAGFIWPVEGRIIRAYTNRSDEKHMGINIGVPRGTEVRAARDGKVVYAGDSIPFYGQMVIITHDGGLASCYALNERLLVREGQRVRQGQVIARSGDNGRGGEPYLHFEIRRNGDAIDPEPFLP